MEPGVFLDGEQARHGDRTELAHAAEVVAYEVDDHHVLGAVLGQEPVGRGGSALDRLGLHDVAGSPQEPLGRRRGDMYAVAREPHDGGERRGVALGQCRAESGDVGASGQRRRQHPAQVHLVDVAGGDRLADGGHARAVRLASERGIPASDVGPPPGRSGPSHRGADAFEASADGRAAEGHHDGPETTRVEGVEVDGDVAQTGAETTSDHSERAVLHRSTLRVPRTIAARGEGADRRAGGVAQGRPRVQRGRDRPACGAVGSRPHLPGGDDPGDGRPRVVRHPLPRGVRRRRSRPDDVVPGDRGARPLGPVRRHHPRGGRRARRHADLPLRLRGAEAGLAPDLCAGRALGRLRPHRTRRRLRCRGDPHDGRARRGHRRVGDRRREGLHHELGHGDDVHRHGHRPHRARGRGAASTGEISTIVVPAGTPGFDVQPPYRKMGWHASDTHGLTFSSCRVPEANLLGARGRGFAQFLEILDEGRIAISALACGVIRCCLEEATAYAKDRHAFGRPIGANQAVAFGCADLAVLYETARLVTYDAAWRHDTGQSYKQQAAVAKLHSTEAAVSATRVATQVFGGYGFMDETLVARQYRDAKILEIGEGTSEIQRLVISRGLGLPVS